MSQDAGDTKESKRLRNPAYVYGPMVYQFPSEPGGENENGKSKRFQNVNFLATALIIVLAVGGAILYMKGNGMEIGQLNFSHAISGQPFSEREIENQLQPRVLSRAWVAADSLYLREGPGTRFVQIGAGDPVLSSYERVAFEKELIAPPGQPLAAFV
ncbi:MAG: hypothetical protein L0220_04745, partial [Acidobacteria bacterium]|nr:hypothetical protein [Acidobacteriota bacterium]